MSLEQFIGGKAKKKAKKKPVVSKKGKGATKLKPKPVTKKSEPHKTEKSEAHSSPKREAHKIEVKSKYPKGSKYPLGIIGLTKNYVSLLKHEINKVQYIIVQKITCKDCETMAENAFGIVPLDGDRSTFLCRNCAEIRGYDVESLLLYAIENKGKDGGFDQEYTP